MSIYLEQSLTSPRAIDSNNLFEMKLFLLVVPCHFTLNSFIGGNPISIKSVAEHLEIIEA